ncbi:MAG TPA: hypothetical protein VE986_05100, partial [Hyphomicrobiales bacterium]|nr:hypothetical protein [Hyphomicrobiales bacterium]
MGGETAAPVWPARCRMVFKESGFVSAENCEDLLVRLEGHRLEYIRDTATFIRRYLDDRKEWMRICEASDAARSYAERS